MYRYLATLPLDGPRRRTRRQGSSSANSAVVCMIPAMPRGERNHRGNLVRLCRSARATSLPRGYPLPSRQVAFGPFPYPGSSHGPPRNSPMLCVIGAPACGFEPPAGAHVPVPVFARFFFSYFAPALLWPRTALASFSWDPSHASIPTTQALDQSPPLSRPAHTPPPLALGPALKVDGHRGCCIFKPLFLVVHSTSHPQSCPEPILRRPKFSACPPNCAGSNPNFLPRARFSRFSFPFCFPSPSPTYTPVHRVHRERGIPLYHPLLPTPHCD
jgi:hypothetical protein